ncbi:uncharacterized protein LOC131888608 [Tigriopus californicus]|nr:uncharacterized protein LOC131888608 [Tigriopus californicus]|eukprot:TCALIF_03998-PA protein Name:"Protein of unknown function" AED:0.64 eAED:0.64 QI:0/-1/0/1/-1/1/1/0/127
MTTPNRNRGFFVTKNHLNSGSDNDSSSTVQPNTSNQFFRSPEGPSYDENRNSALLALFFYSGLMFTVPILVFFGVQQILRDSYDVQSPWDMLAPAIAAIASVNVIIIAYVMRAFREDHREKSAIKSD